VSKLPTFTFHASQRHSSVHGLLSHTTAHVHATHFTSVHNVHVLQPSMSLMWCCKTRDLAVLAECVLHTTSLYSTLEASKTKVTAQKCTFAGAFDSAVYASDGGSILLEKCNYFNNSYDLFPTHGSSIYTDAPNSNKIGCNDCDPNTMRGGVAPLIYAPVGSYPSAQDPIFVERQQV
jgi:hypothetical protein